MTDILLTILGILLPCAAMFFVLNRWFAPVPARVAASIIGLVFLFLHGAIFTSRVPLPLDEVARGFPYAGVVGHVSPRNPLTNDTVKLFLPWMTAMREELFAGRIPLWNRYSFSGYPLLGNGESAPFSPFFLVTLFVPLPKQMVAMAALKLVVALVFGYLFLQMRVKNEWASLFGSVVFAFSVPQTVYLYYTASTVAALLPALCFATFYSLSCNNRRGALLLAFTTAAILSAGHPESVFHCVLALLGLLAIDAILSADKAEWIRSAGRVTMTAVIGALVAAPSWIPVLEQVVRSTRFAEIHAGAGRIMTTRMPGQIAWLLLSPNAFGNPARHTWSWIMNYSVVASCYVGLIALTFFGVALLGRDVAIRDRLTALFALLTFLVAMRWTFIGDIVNHIPPFDSVANDKLRFVTCFLAGIAAAAVLARIGEARSVVAVVTSAFLGLSLSYLLIRKLGVTLGWTDAVGVFVLLILVLALFFARPQRLAAIALVLTALELLVLNSPFNALVSRRYYLPPTPVLDRLKALAPSEPFRIVGLDWVFLPNLSAEYGLEDIRGSDPMSWQPYTRFLDPITVHEPADGDVQRVVKVDDARIDFLNVRFLLTDPAAVVSSHWREVYFGPDGRLFENERFVPRFFIPRVLTGPGPQMGDPLVAEVDGIATGGRVTNGAGSVDVRQLSSSSFRVNVNAERSLVIASSEPYVPGWVAMSRGKRLQPRVVNGAFFGFEVPGGKSGVTVHYEPVSFRLSVAVFLVGIALLFLQCFWIGRDRCTRLGRAQRLE
ncbi:MAG TPA: YfhO family protein [Thermoanaerobaculia bacterium]|nr:YfhO family protein [Thermoanaerobaculia bacterium]